MRRKRWVLSSFFLGCSLLLQTAAFGQPYDLDPQKWYPLDVGNAWHYKVGTGFDLFVHAERDTLVDGARWVLIREQGSSALLPRWLRFSEDHYVLRTHSFTPTDLDTLWTTTPRSIFTVNIPYDSTLRSPWAESATRREGFADVFVDTTVSGFPRFKLRANLGFTGEVFSALFLYEIGYVSDLLGPNLGGFELYAAIIDSVEFGDVSMLKSFLVSTEEEGPPREPALALEVYPNPFRSQVTLSVRATRLGPYQVAIYNVLGQRVYCAEARLSPGQPWTLAGPVGLPSGTYFVYVSSNGRVLATKTAVHLK